jgi:hypothetical protein
MKPVIILIVLSFVAMFSACSMQNVESMPIVTEQNSAADKALKKQPVLVELYTSEGCSSCPPADQALAFLEKQQPYAQAEIITLALHVDYWNNLDWNDEYSSPLFSQRQTVYAQKLKLDSTYTPQMIVDGRIQFVGSNLGEAGKAITEAAKSPKANIEAALNNENNENTLKIKISDIPKHEDSTVFLAIAENNLASNVKRGENAGKNLEHTSVVRELKPLAKLEAKSGNFEQEIALNIQPNWKTENLSYVIFIQENETRRIIGIQRIGNEK